MDINFIDATAISALIHLGVGGLISLIYFVGAGPKYDTYGRYLHEGYATNARGYVKCMLWPQILAIKVCKGMAALVRVAPSVLWEEIKS